MGEHSSSIKGVSLHPNGRYVLAITNCNAVLWDLDTFSKCRTLNGGQDVGVQDVRVCGCGRVCGCLCTYMYIYRWFSLCVEHMYVLLQVCYYC